MSVIETPQMDRVHYLVTELLEANEDPREILDTVRDSIREWRQRTGCPHERLNEDGICRTCGKDCRGSHEDAF
jgi:hypothetical protein